MVNKNDTNKNQTTEQQSGSEGQGRIHNSQNPAVEQPANADISAVDQQEGVMHNGETGMSNLAKEDAQSSENRD